MLLDFWIEYEFYSTLRSKFQEAETAHFHHFYDLYFVCEKWAIFLESMNNFILTISGSLNWTFLQIRTESGSWNSKTHRSMHFFNGLTIYHKPARFFAKLQNCHFFVGTSARKTPTELLVINEGAWLVIKRDYSHMLGIRIFANFGRFSPFVTV